MKSDEARRSHLDPRQIDSLFAQDEYYTRAFTWAFGLYSSHIDEMINAAIPHIRRRFAGKASGRVNSAFSAPIPIPLLFTQHGTKAARIAVIGAESIGCGETDMADDKTKRAPQDAKLISMNEDYEMTYWTHKFNVSKQRLAESVSRVGPSAAAVEAELQK